MKSKVLYSLLAILMIMAGCSNEGKKKASHDNHDAGRLEYAENLFIEEGDEFTVVTLRNPWDTTKTLQKYVLVPRETALPPNLPDGKVIRIPVKNALVCSSIHSGLINELGAGMAIGGVCNARYVTDSILSSRISSGNIMDCGEDTNPDVEKIVKLSPEIIMVSTFDGGDRNAKLAQLGVPVVECADYMENSALGQAEWMRFYGMLFGKATEAQERFDTISARYNKLKETASATGKRPRILLDRIYGQSWSVPGGESTISKLITDAGGENPFSRIKKSGGVQMSPEKVLAEAGDADIWLIRYNQNNEKNLPELSRDAAVNSQFKAFKKGDVYGCNTRYVPFFDQTPFNPHLLLEDMIKIFHPGILPGDTTLRYFKKMDI